MDFRRFTAAEDGLILRLRAEGKSIPAIAHLIGRTPESVRWRLLRLARRALRPKNHRR